MGIQVHPFHSTSLPIQHFSFVFAEFISHVATCHNWGPEDKPSPHPPSLWSSCCGDNSTDRTSCFWAKAAEKMFATDDDVWSLRRTFWHGLEGLSPKQTRLLSLCGQLYKTAMGHTWWIHDYEIAATEAICVYSIRLSETGNMTASGLNLHPPLVRNTQGTHSEIRSRTWPKRNNWKVGRVVKKDKEDCIKQTCWEKKKECLKLSL